MKNVYVVTMYRYGDREKHSYVLGVFDNKFMAMSWGEQEKAFRANKYSPAVEKFKVNHVFGEKKVEDE